MCIVLILIISYFMIHDNDFNMGEVILSSNRSVQFMQVELMYAYFLAVDSEIRG